MALITGMGSLGPWGPGVDGLSRVLREGHCPMTCVPRVAGIHGPSSALRAGLVDPEDYRRWSSGPLARRMCKGSRMVIAAARMAAESAALDENQVGGLRTAVSLGTTIGSSGFTSRLLDQIKERGPQAASPFLFMESVASAFAGQVALRFGARGSSSTLTQGAASGSFALARALYQLRSAGIDRVIAGSVDELGAIPHALLDRFRALARPEPDGRERARVFDQARAGYLASEGSTILMLESEELANSRGARGLGRLRCAIRAFDTSAPAHDWGTGEEQLALALRQGLAREGLEPGDFDRIVSGACGSRAGDRLEGLILRKLWGAQALPPILAPKGVIGEYGGGQLAAALLALTDQSFAALPGFENPDPELGIRPHDGSELPAAHRVLVSSLSAGGAACWLVLESCP